MPRISRRTFMHSTIATAASAAAWGGAYHLSRPRDTLLPLPPLLPGKRVGDTRVYELTARRGATAFHDGMPAETFGYNGDFLGPVIRMTRGEDVRLDVTNELGEPTTCHWHGLHVPAVADGGPHSIIQPGETWEAFFQVKNEAATYWYHSHLEGRTGEQVYKGLAGMIIIDDPELDVAGLPSRYGVDDFPLVVQDRRFSSDGQLVYMQMGMDAMMGMMGNYLLVNGAITPTLKAPAQHVRLRLLNGSNARIYTFGFADYRPFWIVASDGGLLPAPLSRRRLSVATGERYEIVVDLSSDTGTVVPLMSYPEGDTDGFLVVDIDVDGGIETVPTSIPEVLRPAPTIDAAEVSEVRQFDLAMGMGMMGMGTMGGGGADAGMGGGGGRMGRGGAEGGMGAVRTGGGNQMAGRGPGGFTINGVSMDMSVINETVKLGAVEEWRVVNHSPMTHPFHIHDVQFLVQSRNGMPPPEHERGWKDTVQVRPDETVSILAHFTDFADPVHPYMYHCHILEHEDRGMMGQFVVTE